MAGGGALVPGVVPGVVLGVVRARGGIATRATTQGQVLTPQRHREWGFFSAQRHASIEARGAAGRYIGPRSDLQVRRYKRSNKRSSPPYTSGVASGALGLLALSSAPPAPAVAYRSAAARGYRARFSAGARPLAFAVPRCYIMY